MADRAGGRKTSAAAPAREPAEPKKAQRPTTASATGKRKAASATKHPTTQPEHTSQQRGAAKKSATTRDSSSVQAQSTAAAAAKGASMAKSAESKPAGRTKAAPRGKRSAAETEKIRQALTSRRDELQEEYEHTLAELTELQRERLTDSAGDDQADTGTKTFEREQEITLANTILERVTQVERALERLDDGTYGWCERCGNAIPVERLAAFPSATLCVSCKKLEERR